MQHESSDLAACGTPSGAPRGKRVNPKCGDGAKDSTVTPFVRPAPPPATGEHSGGLSSCGAQLLHQSKPVVVRPAFGNEVATEAQDVAPDQRDVTIGGR